MGGVALKVVSMLDGDAEARVYSQLDRPLESMTFLRRSLLFAELANLSYLSRTEAGMLAYRIGFPEIRYYDNDGAQEFIF
jgi:triacylglycerol lipase